MFKNQKIVLKTQARRPLTIYASVKYPIRITESYLLLITLISSPFLAVPPLSTFVKIPSLGITQSPETLYLDKKQLNSVTRKCLKRIKHWIVNPLTFDLILLLLLSVP